jgi:hypothetical protein
VISLQENLGTCTNKGSTLADVQNLSHVSAHGPPLLPDPADETPLFSLWFHLFTFPLPGSRHSRSPKTPNLFKQLSRRAKCLACFKKASNISKKIYSIPKVSPLLYGSTTREAGYYTPGFGLKCRCLRGVDLDSISPA